MIKQGKDEFVLRSMEIGKSGIPGDVREHRLWWVPENRKKVLDMLAGWLDLAEKYGTTVGNLVIAWTLARCDSFQVLCGARKPVQIRENLKAGGLTVEKSDLERMTRDSDEVIRSAVQEEKI